MHARYMLWPCLCLSVCVPVTSRYSTKMAKYRITKTKPHDSSGNLVFRRQNSPRNSTGVPPTGAPNAGGEVGWVKTGDFRQITGYISKTVQDRCTVSIKVEEEVVCALSNGDIADDTE